MTLTVLALADIGWLTSKLLRVTLSSAEWVLWLLVALSVASCRGDAGAGAVLPGPAAAQTATSCRPARRAVSAGPAAGSRAGRAGGPGAPRGAQALPQGPAAVEEVLAGAMAAERPRTSGSSPSSARWGATPRSSASSARCSASSRRSTTSAAGGDQGAAIQQTVMAGISEALVATAVGPGGRDPRGGGLQRLHPRAEEPAEPRPGARPRAGRRGADPRTEASAATRPVRGVVEG